MVLMSVPRIHKGEEKVVCCFGGFFVCGLVDFCLLWFFLCFVVPVWSFEHSHMSYVISSSVLLQNDFRFPWKLWNVIE